MGARVFGWESCRRRRRMLGTSLGLWTLSTHALHPSG